MSHSTCFGAKWLTGAAFAGSILLGPAAGPCGQMSYDALLQATLTVTSVAAMSVARSAGGVETGSASNAVTINSRGSTPYILFFDQGRNATGSQRNLRGNAGIAAYNLCGDAACATVWAPNGDPQTGILVTPGSAATALPLAVVRPANAVDDGSSRDVVTLTMYF